jgi:membrane-associated phospholipid phosphatase
MWQSFRVLLSFTAALVSVSVNADEPIRELRYKMTTDVTVTAIGAVGLLGTNLFQGSLAPATCHWCDRNSDGSDSLNSLDRGIRNTFKWSNPESAASWSNLTAFAILPVSVLSLTALSASRAGQLNGLGVDALVIAEAVILTGDLNQLVKFTAGRERPFVHDLMADQKSQTSSPDDNNTSFFSGHSSFAFSLAVSSGTVASMRGYHYAPWIWGAGMTAAVGTAYLRVAADRHYFTDVMTGATVGSATGFLVPYLFHRPTDNPDQKLPQVTGTSIPGGAWMQLSWAI